MKNAQLRKASVADIAGMHRVRLAVRENRLSRPDRITHADYVAALEQHGHGWLVECDGVIVGFAIAYFADGNIWALFVDPEHEGQGHGRRLHAAMIEALEQAGVQRLWLTTGADTRAAGWYPRQGWQACGLTPSGDLRFEMALGQGATQLPCAA